MNPPRSIRAFSLVEVLAAVATIGVVATIAYVAVGDISKSSREQKLASDADTLNRALQVYLANGGSVGEASSPAEIISRLKSATGEDTAFRLPGLTSQLVDPRLSVRMQSGKETQSTDLRVVWNADTQEFEVGRSGQGGVKEFILDDTAAENAPTTVERTASMLYSKESGWIWDYQDRNPPSASVGPTVVSVTPEVASASVPPSAVPGPPTPPVGPPVAGTLNPPVFSIPGGTYSIRDFEMAVTIVDPNAPGNSKIVYAIDYGAWIDYSSPVVVPPGSTLSAQTLALNTDWADSRKIDQTYEASPETLDPPIIATTRDSFGYLFGRSITVSLTNPNPAGSSNLRYRLNGGSWIDYTGPFAVSRSDFPNGLDIESEAVPTTSPYWTASTVSNRDITVSALQVSGDAGGTFFDPLGSAAMVTNLTESGVAESSYFDWGDVVRRKGDTAPNLKRSSLEFAGLGFGDILEGERFLVGELDYYNGSPYAWDLPTLTMSTGADGVSFGIDISMVADGMNIDTRFSFDFELLNVINVNDPLNPWQDADFVRISSPVAVERLQIEDRFYEFRIEFGESTIKGFAEFDEFYVLENASASVNVYGTFYELTGSSDDDD